MGEACSECGAAPLAPHDPKCFFLTGNPRDLKPELLAEGVQGDPREEAVNQVATRHPHEPEIPPALDGEGRCFVCRLMTQVDELEITASEVAEELRADAATWLETDVPHRFGAAKRCRALADRLSARTGESR